MNDLPQHPDLEPDMPAGEAAALVETAERLFRERPIPRAAFRAQLRAVIREANRETVSASRPQRLWLKVIACSGGGMALLALVAIGTAGAGPFAS